MRLVVPSHWRRMLTVCTKCEKKLKGGFGDTGGKPLSALLRKRAGGKGRKATFGVVSSKCLKLCPKGGVVVIDGARPRDWLIVAARTPLDEVERRLGLDPAAPDQA